MHTPMFWIKSITQQNDEAKTTYSDLGSRKGEFEPNPIHQSIDNLHNSYNFLFFSI